MKLIRKKLALAFLVASFGCLCISVAQAAVQVPDFALPAIQDQKVVDINKFRGKAVLINFWATWCGPCVQEIPSLISLQDEFGPQGLTVIGVSMDQNGEGAVRQFIGRQEKNNIRINYPLVMANRMMMEDFGGLDGESKGPISLLPTTFLIDQAGNLRKSYKGNPGHEAFVADIKKLLQ